MGNFLKFFLNLFGGSDNSVLGIDIGSSSVKVVQLRKKAGQAILETYGELALGPYANLEIGRATRLPIDKIAEALKDLLRESNTTTKKCGLAIPLSSSMVSLIDMPAVDGKQLAQMIPIEARKYIPVPIAEITLDWWIIPKEEKTVSNPMAVPVMMGAEPGPPPADKISVLVVAIHNEAITKYQELVHAVGIDSTFFEIEIFSTMRAVLNEENSTVMIFDMGAASTKLYIIDRGIVMVSHTVNRGSQDITLAMSRALNISVAEAEKLKRESGILARQDSQQLVEMMSSIVNFTFSEANRVMHNFQFRNGKSIGGVILTGGGVNLKGFYEMASKGFSVPVSMADPFAKLKAPAFLDPVLKGAGPEFAVAIGVALRKLQEVK